MFLLIYFFSINLFGDEPLLTDQIPVTNTDLFIEKIPEMKARKEICIKFIKDRPSENLPKCMIEGTGDGQLPALTPKQITNLSEQLKLPPCEPGVPPSILTCLPHYEGKELYPTEQKYDSAIKKLGDYYFKKLNEALYGKQDKKLLFMDHETFYDIYKSQVSKNLVESLSSYCIEADEGNKFIIYLKREKREEIRDKNIKNLEYIEGEGEDAESTAYKNWAKCLKGIQHICYRTKYFEIEDKDKDKDKGKDKGKEELIADYFDETGKDWEYSNRRACLVMNYLKSARQTILKVTKIQELMNYVDGDSTKRRDWFKDFAGVDLFERDKIQIDSITGFTSADLKKSEMEEENKELVKKFNEKCGTNKDPKECQKLIFQNEEKSYDLAAEVALKTTAMLERIGKMTDEELKVYLREQGYPEEKIKELAKYKKELVDEVSARYKKEQDALIAELGKRIQDRTIEKINPAEQKEKIAFILAELAERPKEFRQLIHFNNMVYGYLRIDPKDKNKKGFRNFQNIFRELSEIESSTDKADLEHIKNLRDSLAKHSIFAKDRKEDPDPFSVETLNDAVLKYQVEKNAEKPGWDTGPDKFKEVH